MNRESLGVFAAIRAFAAGFVVGGSAVLLYAGLKNTGWMIPLGLTAGRRVGR